MSPRRTAALNYLATVALCAGAAACSGQAEIPSQSSGAGGQGSTSSENAVGSGVGGGAGGGGAAGGGGGAPVGSPPPGYFMQPFIGNCINAEEWLTFGPDTSFTHTFVDRDFCGPHSVTATPGSASSDGHEIELTWAPSGGKDLRRHTFAIIDSYASIQGQGWPPVDGYELGPAALNKMAYFRSGDAPIWHRDDRSSSQSDAGGLYDVTTTVDVSLDAPLAPPSGPTACAMKVTISVAILTDAGSPASVGSETFSLPCTYAPDDALGWIRLTADGFEDSPYDGSWMSYFEQNGIWKKYPSMVASALYDAFRPVLFYVPSDDARLFHDVSFAWYQEMKSPPPASVD